MYSRSAEFTGGARSEVEFATNVFVALQRALHSGVLAGFTCGMVVVGYSVCLRRYKKVAGGGADGENSYVEVANDALLEHNAGLVFYIKWGDVLMEMRPVGCFRCPPPGAAVHTRPGSPFQVSRSAG